MGEDSFIAARRRARTVALQILYEVDSVDHPLDQVSGRYLTAERLPEEAISFARGLVEGVVANAIRIDGIISEFAQEILVGGGGAQVQVRPARQK